MTKPSTLMSMVIQLNGLLFPNHPPLSRFRRFALGQPIPLRLSAVAKASGRNMRNPMDPNELDQYQRYPRDD